MLVGEFYCIFRRNYQQKWVGQRYVRPTEAKKWAGHGPAGPIASAAYGLVDYITGAYNDLLLPQTPLSISTRWQLWVIATHN
jgi:hypothetical protein